MQFLKCAPVVRNKFPPFCEELVYIPQYEYQRTTRLIPWIWGQYQVNPGNLNN